jgi:hypothetical protein
VKIGLAYKGEARAKTASLQSRCARYELGYPLVPEHAGREYHERRPRLFRPRLKNHSVHPCAADQSNTFCVNHASAGQQLKIVWILKNQARLGASQRQSEDPHDNRAHQPRDPSLRCECKSKATHRKYAAPQPDDSRREGRIENRFECDCVNKVRPEAAHGTHDAPDRSQFNERVPRAAAQIPVKDFDTGIFDSLPMRRHPCQDPDPKAGLHGRHGQVQPM